MASLDSSLSLARLRQLYMQRLIVELASIAQALGSSRKIIESFDKAMEEAESAKKKLRTILRVVSPQIAKSISEQAKNFDSGVHCIPHMMKNLMTTTILRLEKRRSSLTNT